MSDPVRVVVITGGGGTDPTGTAERLGKLVDLPSTVVDLDRLATVWPPPAREDLLDLMLDIFQSGLEGQLRWGVRTVVLSSAALTEKEIAGLAARLGRDDLDWSWYRLRVRPEAAGCGTDIDVDHLAPDDVVSTVIEHERRRAEPDRRPAPEAVAWVRIPQAQVERSSVTALVGRGVPLEDARACITALLKADDEDAPSHGLIQLPDYCRALDDGEIVPDARPHVRRAALSWWVDGNRSLGYVTVGLVRELLAEARTAAAPVVVRITRGGHLGRLGALVRPLARDGLVVLGFATFSGTGQKVAPAGSGHPRLATNPFVLGFPGPADRPVIVDLSSSAWSEGAVRIASATGQHLPGGVLIDVHGESRSDPRLLYRPSAAVALAPSGWSRAGTGHKGYALAVAAELLGGALGGGVVCSTPRFAGTGGNSALLIAFRPEHLGRPLADVIKDVGDLERHLGSAPPIDAGHPVRLPGRGPVRAPADGMRRMPESLWTSIQLLAERDRRSR